LVKKKPIKLTRFELDVMSALWDLGTASVREIQEQLPSQKRPAYTTVQTIVYRGTAPNEPAYAVAEKQLYASHYFETALDLTVCVRDTQRPNQVGFYLITMKGSQQAGLTGLKGSIVRKVAVGKTRSSLEQALVSIKQKLEAQPD